MIALLVASLLLATASASQALQHGFQLRILEAGTYTATQVSPETKPVVVVNPKLIRETTSIAADLRVRFGLRYLVVGGAMGTSVAIKMVTRFPINGDNVTSGAVRFSAYTVNVPVGRVAYRDFSFHSKSEFVEGEWAFEFWVAERKLGEQVFCVIVPSRPPPGCALVHG
jgi:esterase/lipase superfamily enzyme